jgi:hypothetical protein
MMNVLQLLPQWKQAFGCPTGSKLGLLSAIQASAIYVDKPAFATYFNCD